MCSAACILVQTSTFINRCLSTIVANLYRGEPVGECGGCQVMSNPLILHGTQIALPKPRPPQIPNPMPRIPEGNAESSQPSDGSKAQPGVSNPPEGVTAKPSPQRPFANKSQVQPSPTPFRSASNASSFSAAASQPARASLRVTKEPDEAKDSTLNADERLKRLRLRMQHTIDAYSGKPSHAAGAGRYNRTQSLPAASLHAAYHRTDSSPVRLPRTSLCRGSQRVPDDASSCHSSTSCSSAATPASIDGGAKDSANGVPRAKQADAQQQNRSMSSQRGIPQVVSYGLPVAFYLPHVVHYALKFDINMLFCMSLQAPKQDARQQQLGCMQRTQQSCACLYLLFVLERQCGKEPGRCELYLCSN